MMKNSDVEKKRLGNSGYKSGYNRKSRKKENILSVTGRKSMRQQKGIKLIEVVPDEVKSPKLTADWETMLQHMEKKDRFLPRAL
ncbi:MAG: hypothetical protein L6V87_04390 [Ruminococcus sp.]|nr:MAG: hypothetical protein L6V87_04390 [Ruminococcus sp.]